MQLHKKTSKIDRQCRLKRQAACDHSISNSFAALNHSTFCTGAICTRNCTQKSSGVADSTRFHSLGQQVIPESMLKNISWINVFSNAEITEIGN